MHSLEFLNRQILLVFDFVVFVVLSEGPLGNRFSSIGCCAPAPMFGESGLRGLVRKTFDLDLPSWSQLLCEPIVPETSTAVLHGVSVEVYFVLLCNLMRFRNQAAARLAIPVSQSARSIPDRYVLSFLNPEAQCQSRLLVATPLMKIFAIVLPLLVCADAGPQSRERDFKRHKVVWL